MMADMELSITGCAVGKMHEIVWCHVKNLAEPIALHVDFEVKVRSRSRRFMFCDSSSSMQHLGFMF